MEATLFNSRTNSNYEKHKDALSRLLNQQFSDLDVKPLKELTSNAVIGLLNFKAQEINFDKI